MIFDKADWTLGLGGGVLGAESLALLFAIEIMLYSRINNVRASFHSDFIIGQSKGLLMHHSYLCSRA